MAKFSQPFHSVNTLLIIHSTLRGEKTTVFEGGTLVPAFIHSQLLSKTGMVSRQMMHITDWLPSLMTAAGVTNNRFEDIKWDIDGIDVWKAVINDEVSPRTEVVYNIDDVGDGGRPIAALRQRDWKLVQRPSGNGGWIDEPKNENDVKDDQRDPRPAPPPPVPTNQTFLFNLKEDPEERIDLSEAFPDKVADMVDRIKELSESLVEPDNPDTVFAGNPVNFGWVWSTGWCNVTGQH